MGCAVIVVGIAVVAAVVALEAWAFQILWNWVVVSMFHTQPISFSLAFGACMILTIVGNHFRSTVTVNKDK